MLLKRLKDLKKGFAYTVTRIYQQCFVRMVPKSRCKFQLLMNQSRYIQRTAIFVTPELSANLVMLIQELVSPFLNTPLPKQSPFLLCIALSTTLRVLKAKHMPLAYPQFSQND